MHAYDAPRRQPFPLVPAPVRSVRDFTGGPSATPIYDALYAEYVKSFRSLPGDRSGEEKLGFTTFENGPRATDPHVGHGSGTFSGSVGAESYGAHDPGVSDARRGEGWQSQWQRVPAVGLHAVRRTHAPTALPPAPRRET